MVIWCMQTQQEERKCKGNITELLCYILLLDKATRRNKLEEENGMETMLYFIAGKQSMRERCIGNRKGTTLYFIARMHNKKRKKWKQK